jgi:hypothetical protein
MRKEFRERFTALELPKHFLIARQTTNRIWAAVTRRARN